MNIMMYSFRLLWKFPDWRIRTLLNQPTILLLGHVLKIPRDENYLRYLFFLQVYGFLDYTTIIVHNLSHNTA